jgi:hypothetical protein
MIEGSEFESQYDEKFSIFHVVQTGSGGPPSLYSMYTGDSFPTVKRPECEADDSPPSSAEFKKMWIYTSTPPYNFMV